MEFDPKQFDKIVDRTQTWSVKWDPDYMIERYNQTDLLPFNHAEMDFECAQPIIDAIKERANHGIYGYTLVKAEYYNEIIKWFKTRYDIEYSSEDIIYSTGVITGYRQAVNFFTKPNDNVLLLTPIYKPLAEAVTEIQRKLVNVPLTLEENKYFIDFDLLEKTFEYQPIKLFSMCNPHNPVGRVWTEKELKKIGDICLSHNTLVVSDAIHCDLTAKNYKYIPFASVSDEHAMNSITITSATKTFNLSGLKVANIHIQNPELRKVFFHTLDKKFAYAPSVFGIIALITAYSKCGEWADLLTNYLDENYQFIKDFISTHGLNIDLIHREGTPIAWLDFRRIPIPENEVNSFLVKKARLIFVDGGYFTANGEGFQRMSIGFPRSRIALVMERLKDALALLS